MDINRTPLRALTIFALALALAALGPAVAEKPAGGKYQVMGKTLWVIMTRATDGAQRDASAMDAHMAHQFQLEKEGVLFAAGPLIGDDGVPVGGMIIVRAADREDAIRIADSDPMHARGLRTYTLHQWMLNEGHLNLSIDYSTGNFRLE